jgi:YbbR domain-containing protein
MKLKMTRDELLLKIASLVIAILLWLQIQSRVDPSTQREYSIPLDIYYLKRDLIVTRAPSHVTVVAEGTQDALQQLESNRMHAFVNLSKAGVGQREYQVQLRLLKKFDLDISLKHPKEIIHVENLVRVPKSLSIEERGLPPSDLLYDGSILTPKQVWLVGAESLVAKVKKARVMLDLSKATPGDSTPALVELLGENNQPVQHVRSDPSVATINPIVAAAPTRKRILVNPNWSGSPAFGYKVKRFNVSPNQVEIEGNSSTLAHMTSLDTEPISIQDLTQNRFSYVKLKVPAGIKLIGKNEVRVLVIITTNET